MCQTARSSKRPRIEAGDAAEAVRGAMARRAMAEGALVEGAATRGGDAGRGLGSASPGGGGEEAAEAVAEAAAKAAVEAAAMTAAKVAVQAAAMAAAKAAAAAVEASANEASANTAATELLIAALSSTAPTADAALPPSAEELSAARLDALLTAEALLAGDSLLAGWTPAAWPHQSAEMMPPMEPLPATTTLPVFAFPAEAPAVLSLRTPLAAPPPRPTATAAALAAAATAAALSAFAHFPVSTAVFPPDVTFPPEITAAALAPSLFPLPLSAPAHLPRVRGHQGRTKIWPSQLEGLCAAFAAAPAPDGPARARLATELGMKERSVQIWFQNQRSKVKARSNKAAAMESGGGDELNSPPLSPPAAKRPRNVGKERAPPPPLPRPPPSPPLSPPDEKCLPASAPASPTMVWAPEATAPPSMTVTMVRASVTEMAAHWFKTLCALLLVALPLTVLGLARGWGYLQIVGAPLLAFVAFSLLVPVAGPHARTLPYINGLHFAMAAVRLHTACVCLLGAVPWEPLLLLWLGDAAAQQGSSPSIWTLRPEPRPGAHAALVASTAAVIVRALATAASGGRLFWASNRALCVFQGIVIGLRALYEIEMERDASRMSTDHSPPPPPLLPPQLGGDDIVKLSTGSSLVAACLLILVALFFCPANRRYLAALRLQPPRSRPLRLRKLRLLPRGHSVLVA